MGTLKKETSLSLSELHIGMKVYKSQLTEIYDTYIILTDVIDTKKGLYGQIGFIGKEITDEVSKLRNEITPLTCVFHDSTEIGDDVIYEE